MIVERDDAGLQDQVRDIESVSRMLHSVMLDAVTELEGRYIAASTGFGTMKRLLAGMLHLSATEAGTRVHHLQRRATLRLDRHHFGDEVRAAVTSSRQAETAASPEGPVHKGLDRIPCASSLGPGREDPRREEITTGPTFYGYFMGPVLALKFVPLGGPP